MENPSFTRSPAKRREYPWRRGFSVLLALCWAGLAYSADNFTFQDSGGKKHSLADYRGKWVLVNFWATWCPPCLDEIPDLTALHDAHKDKDLAVIGVAMDYRNPKDVLRFADDYFISYPIVLGTRKSAAQVGPTDALPSSYLYNPQGKLVARHTGALTRKQVEAYIADKH